MTVVKSAKDYNETHVSSITWLICGFLFTFYIVHLLDTHFTGGSLFLITGIVVSCYLCRRPNLNYSEIFICRECKNTIHEPLKNSGALDEAILHYCSSCDIIWHVGETENEKDKKPDDSKLTSAGTLMKIMGWFYVLTAIALCVAILLPSYITDTTLDIIDLDMFKVTSIFFYAILNLWVGSSLKKHSKMARNIAILFSMLSFFYIPIGTLISLLVLINIYKGRKEIS